MALSPGQWHKQVPTDPVANARFRLKLLAACSDDPELREDCKQACREDIHFWINAFVMTYDPRKPADRRVVPWVSWDYQVDAINTVLECEEEEEDLVVQKSRDMGITWMFLLVMRWLKVAGQYHQSLCISKTAEAVDDESPNSLFWKLDFIDRYLPEWLRGVIDRKKFYFGYEDTGGSTTGEASTGRAGVAGRATDAFIDEFPLIKEATLIRQRTTDTSNVRFFNGTHQGKGTEFYNLTHLTPEIRKLTLHWSSHPLKKKGLYRFDPNTGDVYKLDPDYDYGNYEFVTSGPTGGPFPYVRSPWYDAQCRRKGSRQAIAMDLDIDPGGSTNKFFNEITIDNLKRTRTADPSWEGDLFVDELRGRPLALVRRSGGPLRLWMPILGKMAFPKSRYAVGGDLSWGTGATPSSFAVIDADSGIQVAEWVSAEHAPDKAAAVMVALCQMLRDDSDVGARIGWELQGPGVAFGKAFLKYGYGNVWVQTSEVPFTGREKRTKQPGWTNTNNSMVTLLGDLNVALSNEDLTVRSKAFLEECLDIKFEDGNLVHTNLKSSRPDEARVSHADRVIAMGLAWKIVLELTGGRKKEELSVPLEPGIMSLAGRMKAAAATAVRRKYLTPRKTG